MTPPRWRALLQNAYSSPGLSPLVAIPDARTPSQRCRTLMKARKLLRSELNYEAFGDLVAAVTPHADPKAWGPLLEEFIAGRPAAYTRFYERPMLSYYAAWADWPNAARFAHWRSMVLPHEIAIGFEALVRTGQADLYQDLFERCMDMRMRDEKSRYGNGFDCLAAGWIAVTDGWFDKAAGIWAATDPSHPVHPDALLLASQASIAHALVSSSRGIASCEELLGLHSSEGPKLSPSTARETRALLRAHRRCCKASIKALPREWHSIVVPHLTESQRLWLRPSLASSSEG